METKHTPGPWKIIKSDGFSGIIGNDQGDIITPTGPRIDDARLIAAAPELLDALLMLLPGADAMGWNTDKAHAAVAKAEGR